MQTTSSHRAFSLVELSIVLVILGLLAGGVLSGQALIRAAEMRSYVADSQRLITAVASFRDKYFALPGDMNNATQFWGSLGGAGHESDSTCQDLEATTKATCNGNGDGSVFTSAVQWDERFRFWQHLGNAGLLEGSYTGRTDSTTSGSFILTAGKNVPALKGNAIFTVVQMADNLGSSFMMAGLPAGLYVEFRDRGSSTSGANPLTPEEQWNIDTKLDDGKPGTGIVSGPKASWNVSGPTCTTTDLAATSVYNVTDHSKTCRYNLLLQ